MLVVLAILAAPHSGAEQAQMPGGVHASMAQNPPQKAHVTGYEVTAVFRLLRQRLNGRYQFVVHPLVGIKV